VKRTRRRQRVRAAICFSGELLLILRSTEAGKTAYVSAFPETGKKEDDANKVSYPSVGRDTLLNHHLQPKRGKFDGLSRKQTRRKYARELDAELGDAGTVKASIRAAKKAGRPVKITEAMPKPSVNKKRKTSGGGGAKGGKKKSAFDTDGGSREGARAGRSDGVGLKKKGGKGKPAGKGSNKGMKGGKGKK
jgi:ATP-dependent RNA helicase DDX27